MEITTQELGNVELIMIKGRVDSVEAARFARALKTAISYGKYKIVVDMSQLEYMSSAGFRALGDAQRSSTRHDGGGVVLAQVPDTVREALEMVGFTEYFQIFDDVTSAVEFAAKMPVGDSPTGARPASSEN